MLRNTPVLVPVVKDAKVIECEPDLRDAFSDRKLTSGR
jgi:hypothetical protein